MLLSNFDNCKNKYSSNRIGYYKVVRDIINKNIDCWQISLELGPYLFPIIINGDLMDYKAHIPGIKYLHNACDIPWPIEDKKYDIFIALQVWEHLKGKQQNAFREVMRISNNAILSFPYKWKHASKSHANIDDAQIKKWTLDHEPYEKHFVNSTIKQNIKKRRFRKLSRKRVVCFFRF